jgi:hypothetical protein
MLIHYLLQEAPPRITWVRVEKPVFDLAGVLISSLGFTGLCVGVALLLGVAWGVGTILHRRRQPPVSWADHSLHLLEARRP